jgi:hypothetical protein
MQQKGGGYPSGHERGGVGDPPLRILKRGGGGWVLMEEGFPPPLMVAEGWWGRGGYLVPDSGAADHEVGRVIKK